MRTVPGVLILGSLLLTLACSPRVLIQLSRGKVLPAAGKDASGGEKPGAAGSGTGDRLRPVDQEQPVRITSERLTYKDQGQVAEFTGRVRVLQGSTRLEAPYLEVHSEDGRAWARNGVRVIDHERGVTVTARELEYLENLNDAAAQGQVRMISHDGRGNPFQVDCDRMEWKSERKEVLARGHVRVTFQGTTATAEAMLYRRDPQVVEFLPARPGEARPKIEKGNGTITGDRITLRLNERAYEAEGSAQADILPETAPPRGRALPEKGTL